MSVESGKDEARAGRHDQESDRVAPITRRGGKRAKQISSPEAVFPLAAQLRSKEGARLGDVFSFVSGL